MYKIILKVTIANTLLSRCINLNWKHYLHIEPFLMKIQKI